MAMQPGTKIAQFKANPPKQKKGSKASWLEKHRQYTPNIMGLDKEKPGFHPCFPSVDQVDNYERMGYNIAKASDWVNEPLTKNRNQKSKGTELRRKNLILMEISEEAYKDLQDTHRVITAMRAGGVEVEKVLESMNSGDLAKKMSLSEEAETSQ